MNAFADTLLSILFGWLRSLVQGIWSSASSGRFQGVFRWLGDNWFWLLLILCLICTAMDYIIWLIRWRPYIIWRNKLRRLFSRKGKEETAFDQGYDTGVDVDLSDMAPVPAPEYTPWQPPVWQQEVQPALQEEEIPVPQVQEAPMYPPVYEEPLYPSPVYEPAPVQEDMPAPTVRNRRSQRHEKKKIRLPGLLGNEQDEGNAMLDGLPPVVNKEDAFHAPVYPDQYQNQ